MKAITLTILTLNALKYVPSWSVPTQELWLTPACPLAFLIFRKWYKSPGEIEEEGGKEK